MLGGGRSDVEQRLHRRAKRKGSMSTQRNMLNSLGEVTAVLAQIESKGISGAKAIETFEQDYFHKNNRLSAVAAAKAKAAKSKAEARKRRGGERKQAPAKPPVRRNVPSRGAKPNTDALSLNERESAHFTAQTEAETRFEEAAEAERQQKKSQLDPRGLRQVLSMDIDDMDVEGGLYGTLKQAGSKPQTRARPRPAKFGDRTEITSSNTGPLAVRKKARATSAGADAVAKRIASAATQATEGAMDQRERRRQQEMMYGIGAASQEQRQHAQVQQELGNMYATLAMREDAVEKNRSSSLQSNVGAHVQIRGGAAEGGSRPTAKPSQTQEEQSAQMYEELHKSRQLLPHDKKLRDLVKNDHGRAQSILDAYDLDLEEHGLGQEAAARGGGGTVGGGGGAIVLSASAPAMSTAGGGQVAGSRVNWQELGPTRIGGMGQTEEGELRQTAEEVLKRGLRATQGQHQLLQNGVQAKIRDLTRNLVPLEFMFDRGLYNMCADQGMDIMLKAFQKFVNQFCQQAVSAWKEWAAMHKERQNREAASCIQRAIRKFLAAIRIHRLVDRKRDREKMRLFKVRQTVNERHAMARVFQRVWRGFVARSNLWYQKRCHDSATTIQLLFRKERAGVGLLLRKKNHMVKSKAVVKIQKVVRGFRGRQRFLRQKKIRTSKSLFAHATSKEGIMHDEFRKHGGAEVIQRFFRVLPFRIKKKLRHERATITVQCFGRCRFARNQVRKTKVWWGEKRKRDLAARAIQNKARWRKAKRDTNIMTVMAYRKGLHDKKEGFMKKKKRQEERAQLASGAQIGAAKALESISLQLGGETSTLGKGLHKISKTFEKKAEMKVKKLQEPAFRFKPSSIEMKQKYDAAATQIQKRWRGWCGRADVAKEKVRRSAELEGGEAAAMARENRRMSMMRIQRQHAANSVSGLGEDWQRLDLRAMEDVLIAGHRLAHFLQSILFQRRFQRTIVGVKAHDNLAAKVQPIVRGYLGRLWVKHWKVEMQGVAYIQKWMRIGLARRRLQRLIEDFKRAQENELRSKGRVVQARDRLCDVMLIEDCYKGGSPPTIEQVMISKHKKNQLKGILSARPGSPSSKALVVAGSPKTPKGKGKGKEEAQVLVIRPGSPESRPGTPEVGKGAMVMVPAGSPKAPKGKSKDGAGSLVVRSGSPSGSRPGTPAALSGQHPCARADMGEARAMFEYYCKTGAGGRESPTKKLQIEKKTPGSPKGNGKDDKNPKKKPKAKAPKMGPGAFAKMCKECPRMISKLVPTSKMDMMFTKACGKGQKHLAFKEFVQALAFMGKAHYPKTTTFNTFTSDPEMDGVGMHLVSQDDVQLLRLLVENVCTSKTMAKALKEAASDVKKEKGQKKRPKNWNSVKHRATRRQDDAATCVQSKFRAKIGNDYCTELRILRAKETKIQREREGATRIQTWVRMHVAHHRFLELVRQSFKKFIPPAGDDGPPYWYNPHSGHSFWSKPRLFEGWDVEQTIQLPTAEDTFAFKCQNCGDGTVGWWFDDTNERICRNCEARYFNKGKQAARPRCKVEQCVECDFQNATRRCTLNGDTYCDTCYTQTHQKGRMRGARWTALVQPCQYHEGEPTVENMHTGYGFALVGQGCHKRVCEKAAQWQCNEDGKHYCKSHWGKVFAEAGGGVSYKVATLETAEMKQHLEEENERKAKAAHEAALEAEKLAYQERRQTRAVTKISSCWRGAYIRKFNGQQLIESKRAEQYIRKVDTARKKKLAYLVKDSIGKAPSFSTDTHEALLLKNISWYRRSHIKDALNGHFDEHLQLQLVREFESRLKAQVESKMEHDTKAKFVRRRRQQREMDVVREQKAKEREDARKKAAADRLEAELHHRLNRKKAPASAKPDEGGALVVRKGSTESDGSEEGEEVELSPRSKRMAAKGAAEKAEQDRIEAEAEEARLEACAMACTAANGASAEASAAAAAALRRAEEEEDKQRHKRQMEMRSAALPKRTAVVNRPGWREMVETADRDGWLLPGKVSAKFGERCLYTARDWRGRGAHLKRGDRLRIVSKHHEETILFVGLSGPYDGTTVPLNQRWRFPDEEGLRVYRFPTQDFIKQYHQRFARTVNNTKFYQNYLHSAIRIQAASGRRIQRFIDKRDDTMWTARIAMGRKAMFDKKLKRNKELTVRLCEEKDEVLMINVGYMMYRGAMKTKKKAKKKYKEYKKKQQEKKELKAKESLKEGQSAEAPAPAPAPAAE
jgi:hypothetical protein